MSVDMWNRENGSFRCSGVCWAFLAELAQMFGWKPKGTALLPEQWACVTKDGRQFTFAEVEADPSLAPGGCLLYPAPDIWTVEVPDEERWPVYASNELKRIDAGDAANLADALERALGHVPDHDASKQKWELLEEKRSKNRNIMAWDVMSPLEYFSGAGKETLREFIAFCRQGTFITC